MKQLLTRIGIGGAVVALGALAVAGCSNKVADMDGRECDDPLVRKALENVKVGDTDAAIVWLTKALDRNPRQARAHLELGLLYDEYRKDYVRAVYHYQRYMELTPNTEKLNRLEEYIRKAKMSFAASLPSMDDRLTALQRENERLKGELRDVRQNLAARFAADVRSVAKAKAAGAGVPAGGASAGDGKPAVQQDGLRYYQVKQRDTLSTIAARMYGDPAQWKRIHEANSDKLGAGDVLKVGQMLVIPE